VTTNVTAKSVTFLHETNHGCMRSPTGAAVKLSLFQNNDLSYIVYAHRVKCQTEKVNSLSRSLETCKIQKIILLKLKFIKYQNQWYHTKFCFNINLAMCTISHEKLFTQNVTNVTFVFETFPNTKP